MIDRRLVATTWRSATAMLLVLFAGLACGFLATYISRPAPRERALLWDDYIVAAAALYQREGDVARAKERLQEIGVEDPGQTVAALATVYVPDSTLAEGGSAALRDLALALTGRNVFSANASRVAAVPSSATPLSSLASTMRSPLPWLALFLLSASWLALSARLAPHAGRRQGPSYATVPALPGDDAVAQLAGDEETNVADALFAQGAAAGRSATRIPVTATLSYRGNGEPYEQMVPIVDPNSGRLVGGCGLATGPGAPGVTTGHLGLLVWLHESGSAEPPQTLGLVAMPVVSAGEEAMREWMAYARLHEVVVARPGVMKSFETRRLQATLYITDVGTVAIGHGNEAVISRLRIHIEVTFKKRPS